MLVLAVLLAAVCWDPAAGQGATTETSFQGVVAEVRYGDPQGIQLESPGPVSLAANATVVDEANQAILLSDLADRVYAAQDQIRVRVALNDQEEISRLAVLGANVAEPADLQPHERSFTLFFVDAAKMEVIPTGFSFVETTVLDTRILAKDGTRISLNDLQQGTLVEVAGRLEGTRFVARLIQVLQTVMHMGIGGTVIEIERETDTRGVLTVDDGGGDEWVALEAQIYVDGEAAGSDPDVIRGILTTADAPVVATVSERDRYGNGNWGRVDLELGKTAFGRQWENDTVRFQLHSEPARAVRGEHDNGYALVVETPSVRVDEATTYWDHAGQGMEVTFSDIALYMNVNVDLEMLGDEILRANVNINEHPVEVSITVRVNGRDAAGNRVWFDSPSMRLAPHVRLYDQNGNQTDAQQLQDMQYQGPDQYVALVTVSTDPVSGDMVGEEVRLVALGDGVDPGPNQVVVGVFGGMHRGFWVNPTDIGTYSSDGYLLPGAVVRTAEGELLPQSVLDNSVEVEAHGSAVSGRVYLSEVVVLSVFEAFEVTGRLRNIDVGGHWMEFEEPPPSTSTRTPRSSITTGTRPA